MSFRMALDEFYCKAHPDEKGIETLRSRADMDDHKEIAKLIPTKRELKLSDQLLVPEKCVVYCKAHPDEKGIETPIPPSGQNR